MFETEREKVFNVQALFDDRVLRREGDGVVQGQIRKIDDFQSLTHFRATINSN